MSRACETGGAALVDLVMAMMIVGVCLMVTLQQVAISFRGHHQEHEKLFAYQKAMSILSELQVALEQGEITADTELDALGDAQPNPVLTTRGPDGTGGTGGTELAPDHPMSGNARLADGSWKWYRRVDLHPVQGNPTLRFAQIRMFRRDPNGHLLTDAAAGGLVNLPSVAAPPVKEYDVYVLAIAAAPSLWAPLSDLRAFVEAESRSLHQDNPNLRYRLHWITRLGYGRNEVYTPRINVTTAADRATPMAYWYPGTLAAGAATRRLYSAEAFSGHVTTEDAERNGYAAAGNPHPHAVADRWNHCMRTPAARDLFARRVAAGTERADAPPLQLLFDEIDRNPQRYRNAIFVNLHGEGLPCPPLRNYADAARSPAALPGVRVVTHPSRLHVPRDPDGNGDHTDTEDVELRVYGYKTDPSQGPILLSQPITIQIGGVDLTGNVNGTTNSTLDLRRLPGGVDPATGSTITGLRTYYDFAAPEGMPPTLAARLLDYEMCYEVGYSTSPEPHTWIRLYNTPLTAPVRGERGLPQQQHLYGMEYIPSPIATDAPFADDLAAVHAGVKNTARWRIRIPKGPLAAWLSHDRMLTITTRIGADLTTGRRWPTANDPENLSVTYTWWAASATAVPVTERYQFLGDPRHNPYADVAAAHGYNWFFDDLVDGEWDATGSWPCLDAARLHDGFGPGGLTADVPRLLQLWRDALQSTGSVFTHANGRLANYVLLGGEIAAGVRDAIAPQPVQLNGALFGSAEDPVGVDTLSARAPTDPSTALELEPAPLLEGSLLEPEASPTHYGQMVLTDASGTYWTKPWLGELAPDGSAAYHTTGNLQCGSSSFRLVSRATATLSNQPAGTDFAFASGSELGDLGPATLLQGDPEERFQHRPAAAANMLTNTTAGREILAAAGLVDLPPMPGRFPFRADTGLHTEPPHTAFTGSYPAHTVATLEISSEDEDYLAGAGVLRITAPGSSRSAWFVVATDTPSTLAEHRTLASKTLLWSLRGFHLAGEAGDVAQVPQVQIVGPWPGLELHDPQSVELVWRTPFLRFDGVQPFTSGYPGAYEGDESKLAHVVTYSLDGGPFRHVEDQQPATLGVLPEQSWRYTFDAGRGDEQQLVDLPASLFPAGAYVFRVETFTLERTSHSAHHEVHVDIRR